MCLKQKIPAGRASYSWTSSVKENILNKFGIGNTSLTFKCGMKYHTIKIKGVHIDKTFKEKRMDKARLMREAGDKFYFLVDLKEHGVSKASRKRGGYYLYVINRTEGHFYDNNWTVQRFYYSEKDVEAVGGLGLQFYNVYWKIIKHCYHGVAIEDSKGDGNSS